MGQRIDSSSGGDWIEHADDRLQKRIVRGQARKLGGVMDRLAHVTLRTWALVVVGGIVLYGVIGFARNPYADEVVWSLVNLVFVAAEAFMPIVVIIGVIVGLAVMIARGGKK